MRFEVVQLAEGWPGTNTTVEKVIEMVEAAHVDPVVVLKARDLVRRVPERDIAGEVKAISKWVRAHIRYTPERVETLRTPRDLLDDIAADGAKYGDPEKGVSTGDCDEFTTLWGALNSILNHKVRFRVVSLRDDQQGSHIFGEVFIPGRGWTPDDCINKVQPIGWRVRGTTKEKLYGSMKLTDMGELAGPAQHWYSSLTQAVPLRNPYDPSTDWQRFDAWQTQHTKSRNVTAGMNGLGDAGAWCGTGMPGLGSLGEYIEAAGGRILPIESDYAVVLVPNEELGQIVASIITAAATVAAAGANAVMTERALKVQSKAQKTAHQEFEEQLQAQKDATAQTISTASASLAPESSGMPKWVLPVAIGAGALALGIAFLGGAR